MLGDKPWDHAAPEHRGSHLVQCRPSWFTEGTGQPWASHPRSESGEHRPGGSHTPVLRAESMQDTAPPHWHAQEAEREGSWNSGMWDEVRTALLNLGHSQGTSAELFWGAYSRNKSQPSIWFLNSLNLAFWDWNMMFKLQAQMVFVCLFFPLRSNCGSSSLNSQNFSFLTLGDLITHWHYKIDYLVLGILQNCIQRLKQSIMLFCFVLFSPRTKYYQTMD